MSKSEALSAEIREDVGKGASRRLRRAGKVPAVLYGGDREPVALTLEHREVLHASERESFFSSILDIQVGDGQQQVVVRDMHRHPFKQLIMHLDFMRVSATESLRISVPLHFTGEDESPARKSGGVVIQHQITDVEVEAMPKDLPEYIEVDLSGLEPGGAVMLADIVLPEGVVMPALTDEEDSNLMVANAIHISEDQGTGAAAAEEEALAAAVEAGEVTEDEPSAEDAEDEDVEEQEDDS